jgi:hypothetical protein
MVVEGQRSMGRAIVAVAAMALMNAPLSIFTNPGFLRHPPWVPEPWNASPLPGVLLTLGPGVARPAESEGDLSYTRATLEKPYSAEA